MANEFGGKNSTGLYVPITEIEQEFISRLVDSKDMYLVIHEWGFVDQPTVTFGDKNLHVSFKMHFDRPENPIAVYFFDLELRTRKGHSLFRQKMNTEYGGSPLLVMQGLELDMVWDIAIKNIDPKLIKELMPSVTGLTSRLQDKATGEITLLGNMNLSTHQKRTLAKMDQAEKSLPFLEAEMKKQAREEAKKSKQ